MDLRLLEAHGFQAFHALCPAGSDSAHPEAVGALRQGGHGLTRPLVLALLQRVPIGSHGEPDLRVVAQGFLYFLVEFTNDGRELRSVIGGARLDIAQVALGGVAGVVQQDLVKAQGGQFGAHPGHILPHRLAGGAGPLEPLRVGPAIAAVGGDIQAPVGIGELVILKAGDPCHGIEPFPAVELPDGGVAVRVRRRGPGTDGQIQRRNIGQGAVVPFHIKEGNLRPGLRQPVLRSAVGKGLPGQQGGVEVFRRRGLRGDHHHRGADRRGLPFCRGACRRGVLFRPREH